jgi:hypothetical protein
MVAGVQQINVRPRTYPQSGDLYKMIPFKTSRGLGHNLLLLL